MSSSSKRIYKITINNRDIVFSSRSEGERGRDIVAVKYALGDIYQAPIADNSPDDTSIGTQWFSCEDNKLLSVDSLVTFDKKLKTTLMNFQINNQILILNYYWEKMGIVAGIEEETDVYPAIQFSLNQFDANFGRIDEATIAILHGWRPSSTPSNRSFFNSEEYPVEELPRYFYELITQGVIVRPPEGTIRRIIKRNPNAPEAVAMLESFNNSSLEFRKWSSRSRTTNSYFFEYVAASVQGSVVDSVLYVAASQTLSDLESLGMDELTPSQRTDLIAKAIEPNHLTTKDPFEITNFKIGFFNKTEYTFQNLPEFGDISLDLKASLEASALEKVLQYYDKTSTEELNPQLINFIDFRAPSLRPGDVYRAYFEINKTILDSLPEAAPRQSSEDTVTITDNAAKLEQEMEQQKDLFCIGGKTLTDEETKVQYEKYRSFAAKKKLEISRKIRQAALKSQEDQLDIDGIEIDLGIFGKGTLTQSEMTNMLTEGSADLMSWAGSKWPQVLEEAASDRNPPVITMSFNDFKIRCERISKNFAAAAPDLKNFELTGDKFFSAEEQSRLIAQAPAAIETAIGKNKGTSSVYKAVERIEESQAELLSRDDTEIELIFRTTTRGSALETIAIISPKFVTADGKNISDKQKKKSTTYNGPLLFTIYIAPSQFSNRNSGQIAGKEGKIAGPLIDERTVHYIRNMFDLSPKTSGDFSFTAPCDDPLASTDGTGAAYILKHTKGVSDTKKPNAYNPYHNWVEQRKSDITEGIKKRLPNQDTNSADYKLFNVNKDKSVFGFEQTLPMIGDNCTPGDVERYLKKQLNLKTLLCEYMACIGLPDVQIQLPNIPPLKWPKLPTIELPGMNLDNLLKLLQEILTRALCALVKGIIDILRTPLCQEKFIEGIYGAASDVSPQIQRAVADGFLNTGIPVEKTQSSKDLVDAIMNMLSPRELCALFDGESVNEEVYQVIQSLSESFGLEAEFSTRESIRDFFITIGVFVGPQICNDLAQYDVDKETCSDVYGLLNQLRAAAQRGESVSPEKIEEAAQHAQMELASKAAAMGYLGGDGSLSDLLPDLTSLENNPIFSTPKPIMLEAAKVAARSALDLPKSSFVSSVNSYVSSFYINVPGIATVDDESYNSEANMKVQRAVANLQRFSNLNLNLSNLSELQTTLDLRRSILILSDDYEKQIYNNGKTPPFEIYSVRQATTAKDGADLARAALVSNSLVEKYDLTDEGKTQTDLQQLSRLSELTNIWTYMLPITAGDLDDRTRTISTYLDWAKRIFLGQGLNSGDIITLNTSYINKINQILQKLQEDIASNTEAAFVSKTDSLFLKGIKEFYQISEEATRIGNKELLAVSSDTSRTTTTIRHPVEELKDSVFVETKDSTIPDPNGTPEDSRVLVKSNVAVKDDFFLGTVGEDALRFTFCEEVPQHLRNTQDSDNIRVNAYSNIVKNILKSKYSEYSNRSAEDAMAETENLTLELRYPSFVHAYEGTLEQMAHSVRSSRIFEDPDYLDRLDLKIRSKFYFDPAKGCFRNPNNLLKYGALNFDQMVTDLFAEQYLREFASPENSPLIEDYTTPGAFEKAMMNTSLVGFVRLCLVDMLLKGAITLSVWDIDFVKGNKFFREYMVEYVDRQIELQPFFTNNREYLDETLARVSGTNNRSAALRKIVLNNADTIISDISKNLFENDARTDFSTWFLDTMHLVSVPERKTQEGIWKSNLLRDDIIQFRKNNFSFLENYIRIKGPLKDFNSSPAEIASAQSTKLIENLPNLQQIADTTNIVLPNSAEYDIANPANIDINLYQDSDAFPNKELLSVNEFSEVIRSLLDNNSELSRYIHDLTRKIHDPNAAFVHGLPKTMEDRTPAKAIIRTRTRYEFDGSNPFSALFKESPSIRSDWFEVKRADKFKTKFLVNRQKKDSYYFNVMTTGEEEPEYGLNGQSEQEMFSVLQESFKTAKAFDDRFYIQPGRADSVLSNTERLEDMTEGDLSSAEVLSYRSEVKNDNKLGTHDGHSFRPAALPIRTQDYVKRDIPGESGNRDFIFLNEAGKVSKDKFDTFVESNPDLEVEIWEETVIDLIANASPIFNQPGNSGWEPKDHMSDSDMEDIGAALNRQLYFTRDALFAHDASHGTRLDERNQILKSHGEAYESDPSKFVFEILQQDNASVRKAAPHTFKFISETGHRSMPDNFSKTYASNNVEYEKSMVNNYFNTHVKEHELLDVNEYKIPLRILITQVKDRSGNILKVFSKYILPEFLDFKNSALDGHRATEFKDAILKTFRAFERLNAEGFRKKMIENFVNRPDEYTKYSSRFVDPSQPTTSKIKPSSAVYQVLQQGLGSPTSPVVPIMRYPGTNDDNRNSTPVHSGRTASWCSTSKFYSIACQEEANKHTGNFATSESHLDGQFLDPGRLVRRPSSLNYSFSQFKELIRGNVNSEIQNEDLFNANVRHLFVNMKLQKHWLYDNSAGDLLSSFAGLTQDTIVENPAKKTIQTIGNLVSWFNQRREDGFWGATNGNSENIEASNFDVGPSLFYGDNRSNIASFTSAIHDANNGNANSLSSIIGNASSLAASNPSSRDFQGSTTLATGYVQLIAKDTGYDTAAEILFNATNMYFARTDQSAAEMPNIKIGFQHQALLTKSELRNTGIWMYPEELDFNGEKLTSNEAQAMAQVIETEEMADYRAHNVRNSLAHRQVATVLAGRYNAALEEIGLAQIIRDITTAYVSRLEGDETIISDILLDSEVSYGFRVVMNSTNTTQQHSLNRAIKSMWGEKSVVSEEERIGDTMILNSEGQETEFFTLPIAQYEKVISEFDCFLATNPYMFKRKLQEQEAFMKNSLAQTSAFKDFYEFTIPYKNFASMLTVHSISMLAGYGDMPNVLTSTKAAMASVFEAMTVMDPYGEEDFGAVVSAADFSSAYGQLGPSGGSPPDCLSFPDLGQWFELIIEMVQQYIKYFPSVILRGIADGIDPMYKEMKHHYLACQIPDLRNGSWAASSGEGKTPLGLRGSKDGEKMYAPIIPAFPVDIAKGVSKAWSGDFSLLTTSIDKLVGYIYGGPLPFLDAAVAFKIPCLKINQEAATPWGKYEIGGSGRYGHPLTPISLLALMTLELPADRDLRSNLCPQIPNPVVCEDELE